MRSRSRSFLLATLFLLVVPAVGFTCELASALCGLEGLEGNGVAAPPCHEMPDMAMDCCSIQAPAEQPPAASVGRAELQPATLSQSPPSTLASTGTGGAEARESTWPEHLAGSSRHRLLSVYLL